MTEYKFILNNEEGFYLGMDTASVIDSSMSLAQLESAYNKATQIPGNIVVSHGSATAKITCFNDVLEALGVDTNAVIEIKAPIEYDYNGTPYKVFNGARLLGEETGNFYLKVAEAVDAYGSSVRELCSSRIYTEQEKNKKEQEGECFIRI